MLTRRTFAKFLGATALSGSGPSGFIADALAQNAAAPVPRGSYLIRNGAVVAVDRQEDHPRFEFVVYRRKLR